MIRLLYKTCNTLCIVKIRLVGLLVTGALLAISVGPSSAIAMRPRIDNWPAGGTDFYLNATLDQIWPSSLNALDILDSCGNITLSTDCDSASWESLADQLLAYWPKMTDKAKMPESLQITSPESVRLMYTREIKGLFLFFETIATTQMSNLTDSLAEIGRLWSIAANELSNVSPCQPREFMYRNDAIYTLNDVYQPMTTAICWAYRGKLDLQGVLFSNMVEVPIACNDTRRGALTQFHLCSLPRSIATVARTHSLLSHSLWSFPLKHLETTQSVL